MGEKEARSRRSGRRFRARQTSSRIRFIRSCVTQEISVMLAKLGRRPYDAEVILNKRLTEPTGHGATGSGTRRALTSAFERTESKCASNRCFAQ